MLRVMLPLVTAATVALGIDAVAAIVDVGVTVEIVVDVDVDIIVPPTAAPSHHPRRLPWPIRRRTKSPSPQRNSPQGDSKSADTGRWAGRRPLWVVAGNVDDLRIGLLDDDHLFVFDHLGFHLLLLGGFQVPRALGLLAHALHRIHHIALLRQKSISQVGGPLDVIRQPLDQHREARPWPGCSGPNSASSRHPPAPCLSSSCSSPTTAEAG